MDDLDLRIRNHLYGSFVRNGTAALPAEAAAALSLDQGTVAASYRRLHDAHALVLEPGGIRIRMLSPFSAVETSHRIEAHGRRWHGNCAWDALGILHALGADGRIESSCPDCGEPLELEVVDGTLVRGAELLAHFVVPARHWWADIVFT